VSPPPRAKRIYDFVTEAEFQRAVVERATAYGWWCWHDNDSRRNDSGLPDLILVRPPRIVFAELKTENGRVSVVQRAVIAMLKGCPGVEAHLWRPSDEKELDAVLRPE
jgi:hypothetical protein